MWRDFLQPPHGTTPAAVIKNKNGMLRSIKSKEKGIKCLVPLRAKKIFIRRVEARPYLGFDYESLISEPIRSGKTFIRKKEDGLDCTVSDN